MNELLQNVLRLHTTPMGAVRIRRNLGIEAEDVVEWCREKIMRPDALIEKRGKNWYVRTGSVIITVNAHSYTIITAHMQ